MFDLMIKNNRPNRNKEDKRHVKDGDRRAERQLKADRKRQLSRVREQEAMGY